MLLFIMNFLTVSGIYRKEEDNPVLENINFTQQQSDKIAIAGETGSGKSTLLKIIAGWVPPDGGQVMFENERVKKVPSEKLIPGHPGIAYLSQQYELPNFLTVEQVLEYANNLPGEAATILYEVCRIGHLLKRRTDKLSGGEKQRIALARLLVASPRLLLLDEPFSNLDVIHRSILKAVIHDISERLNITCILVSHDPVDTLSWADKIIVIKNGRIIQEDSPVNIYRRPVNEYTAALFGKYNLINASQAENILPLPPIDKDRRKILIRPEDFKIVPSAGNTISGIVNEVLFFGSYYETEVLLSQDIVIVRTLNTTLSKGDVVHLALSATDVWYL